MKSERIRERNERVVRDFMSKGCGKDEVMTVGNGSMDVTILLPMLIMDCYYSQAYDHMRGARLCRNAKRMYSQASAKYRQYMSSMFWRVKESNRADVVELMDELHEYCDNAIEMMRMAVASAMMDVPTDVRMTTVAMIMMQYFADFSAEAAKIMMRGRLKTEMRADLLPVISNNMRECAMEYMKQHGINPWPTEEDVRRHHEYCKTYHESLCRYVTMFLDDEECEVKNDR